MIPLGLSATDQLLYEEALAAPHSIAVTVQVLDLNHQVISDVSGRLLDGQVNVTANQDPSRTCTLTLYDPRRTLSFDSASPSAGALYLDRMVRVLYHVGIPGLPGYTSGGGTGSTIPQTVPFTVGSTASSTVTTTAVPTQWISVPVFTGPLTKMDRDDVTVNIEAGGKELLAMRSSWNTLTVKKNHNRIDALKQVMDLTGETRYTLGSTNARLPKDLSIGRTSVPWDAAKGLAKGMSRHLFYDGRGVLRLRPTGGNPVFAFTDGDGGTVTTPPQVTYSLDELKNIVWVKGGTPKGAKQAISVVKEAPTSHPLSPYALGRTRRDGTRARRFLLEEVEETSIRTRREATDLAEATLNRSLLQAVDVAFDALPVPHLEPRDVARLETGQFAMPFAVTAFSIPLSAGSSSAMSVGYNKRVSVTARKRRK